MKGSNSFLSFYKFVVMECMIFLRLLMFFIFMIMLGHQANKALKSLWNPPIVVITDEVDTDHVQENLLIYFCPLNQHNKSKLRMSGYYDEYSMLFGSLMNHSLNSWGAHINMTFEEMISNISDVSKEDVDQHYPGMIPRMFPKFGYCYEIKVDDGVDATYYIGNDYAFTVLVTDRKSKTYFGVDISSQTGDLIRVPKLPESTVYSYFVSIETYEEISTSPKCESDPNYSYQQCVDDYVHFDLIPKFGCVPPPFSSQDQCKYISKNNSFLGYFETAYIQKYFSLAPTIAEQKCKKACKRVKVTISLKDQSIVHSDSVSYASFTLNPKIKSYKESKNYDLFNYLVDLGSSFGTWAGLSAISLIDFSRNPLHAIRGVFNWLRN